MISLPVRFPTLLRTEYIWLLFILTLLSQIGNVNGWPSAFPSSSPWATWLSPLRLLVPCHQLHGQAHLCSSYPLLWPQLDLGSLSFPRSEVFNSQSYLTTSILARSLTQVLPIYLIFGSYWDFKALSILYLLVQSYFSLDKESANLFLKCEIVNIFINRLCGLKGIVWILYRYLNI